MVVELHVEDGYDLCVIYLEDLGWVLDDSVLIHEHKDFSLGVIDIIVIDLEGTDLANNWCPIQNRLESVLTH